MFIALILFNLVHPGKVMPGKEGDFPSRKARKNFNKDSAASGGVSLLPSNYHQISGTTPAYDRD